MRPTLYSQPWWQQPGTDPQGLVRTAGPAAEPLQLDGEGGVLQHLRVETPEEKALVLGYLRSAREYAERVTGRQLMVASWRLTLDRFPLWEIRLPRPPLLAVTQVAYTDGLGVAQVLDPSLYRVNVTREPGLLEPAYAKVWPYARWQTASVVIDYTAGYAAADLVPATVKEAILLLVGWKFLNREPNKADWDSVNNLLMAEFAEGY